MTKKLKRNQSFKSISGDELKEFYSSNSNDDRYSIDPGHFPYTRGIHKNMYRGKLWTMRQFSGFSTPEKTNERYKYLLKNGQTGLSVAYDMPTLMGYDPDHELSVGEAGKASAVALNKHCSRAANNISSIPPNVSWNLRRKPISKPPV